MNRAEKSSPKIFFGWWIVLVTGIVSSLGHGFYNFGISAFFKDLAAELGLTRAVTSIAVGIGRLEGGITSPLVGWLADKFGPRWVTLIGVCIVIVGLTLMNSINSLWAYLIAWGFMTGIGLNIGLTVANDKALANWFVSKRGLAMGIKFALLSLGVAIVIPIVTWLITIQSWRATCLTWAAVMLASLPFIWLTVKQKRPEYYGLLPDGVKVEPDSETNTEAMIGRGIEYASGLQEIEFTLRQAMRTPAYWMLIVAYAGQYFVNGGFFIHCIPFLTDIGIAPAIAGAMTAIMILFTIPSRFLSGLLADRVRKEHLQFVLAGSFVLQAAGIVAFLLNQTVAMLYVLLVLYGFGNGAATPIVILIRGRYFGRKAFGSINGSSSMFLVPAAFTGPIYAGWIYDTTGSYITAFILFAALAIFSTILALLIRPPKPPARITDIRHFI